MYLSGQVENFALLRLDNLFEALLCDIGVGSELVQFVNISAMVFFIVKPGSEEIQATY